MTPADQFVVQWHGNDISRTFRSEAEALVMLRALQGGKAVGRDMADGKSAFHYSQNDLTIACISYSPTYKTVLNVPFNL